MLCDSLCLTVASFFIATAGIFYAYLKWKYTFWERHNFPFLKPRMLFGNLENPFDRKIAPGMELKKFYDQLKSQGAKHGGVYSFSTPVYIPIDLQYIKNVLSKDFQYFVERGRYYNEEDDPLSAHLFHLGGTRWKNLRVKLTPIFTSGKMRMMFLTLLECGKSLQKAVSSCFDQNQPVEIKDFANKFTTEVIGSVVFGLEVDSFTSSEPEFVQFGRRILKGTSWEAAKYSFPDLARKLKMRRYEQEATDFFMKVITDTVKHRESNNARRNDFLQILIDLKNNVDAENDKIDLSERDGKNLTMEQIAAQSVVFFIAGFDTSATAISFTLFELANNLEIQRKVREEIKQTMARHDGKLTYEGITEMKFMQQVLDETLRKYPSLPLLNRQCMKTYQIPGTDLVIEKGTQVIVPLLGLHLDENYYPEPEKYDPDRFSPENKSQIPPFAYLPFGDGPRNCIGMRFGILQVKTGLSLLLKDYVFTLNPKTALPLQMDMSVMYSVKGGIWLNVAKAD